MNASLEVILAVAIATGCIAALQSAAPAADLGVLYLLAVLAIAIRRGQLAALATAVLGILTLNYLFITPRHHLTIAHSQDFVALVVLMIAAVVVGRLAAIGRQRAAEAEIRARVATAREREASLLAEVASAILAGQSVSTQLESIGGRVARATGASTARVVLEPVPSQGEGEIVLPLRAHTRSALAVLVDRHVVARPGSRADLRAARPADRRRRRAGADRRARGRDRGGPPGGGGPHRDPPRDLTRPALAPDRDHHRRLGAARR